LVGITPAPCNNANSLRAAPRPTPTITTIATTTITQELTSKRNMWLST
jgi:hypothetical protein